MCDLEAYRKFVEVCKKEHLDFEKRPHTTNSAFTKQVSERWDALSKEEKDKFREGVAEEDGNGNVPVTVESSSEGESDEMEVEVVAKPSKAEDEKLEEVEKAEDEKEEDEVVEEEPEEVVTPPPAKKSKASKAEAGEKAPRKTKAKAKSAEAAGEGTSKGKDKVSKKIKFPKKQKDPLQPKKAMSSFFWYSKENRLSVAKANPDFKVGQIAKTLGHQWKLLSDEEKAKYQLLATHDKERYKRDIAAYKSKKAIEIADDEEEEPNGELEMTMA